MFVIRLKDNDYNGRKISFSGLTADEKIRVRKILDSINNIPLKELEEKGLIIFPFKFLERDLIDNSKTVCSIQNLESETPIIKTTNIMGYFSFDNFVQIEITSRFDNDERQFFLHYMLQKVCELSPTIELVHANKNPFYEFLVYLFPYYLKRALSKGAFRTYITREYNDSSVRGVIDFSSHIKNNIPFNGKAAYCMREYSKDNFLTQLIRHTIEFIVENKNLKDILLHDKEVRESVAIIRSCTENYNKSSRELIINKNLKSILHPYYTEYESLRKLCIMILTHNKMNYGYTSQNHFNGILFDGSALWEEYLNLVLKEKMLEDKISYILEHPNNRTGQGRQYLFESDEKENIVEIYPDFLIKDLNQNVCTIIDAKYKNLAEGMFSREDLYQLLTYLFRFKCKNGMLLYPEKESEGLCNSTKKYLKDNEEKISFETYGLSIPDYSSEKEDKTAYNNFCKRMRASENNLTIICGPKN